MLAIIAAILGFASPFLPELVKFFQRKQENAHEKEMMQLRLQAGAQEHLWKMEEITAQADIEESKQLHKPMVSFGAQILDAAKDTGLGKWALVPAFYLFTLLDFAAGMVRPAITYAAFAFYVAYKWALVYGLTGPTSRTALDIALRAAWGEQDWAVLTLVLSYWFGHRAAKAAFGGNAMASSPAR